MKITNSWSISVAEIAMNINANNLYSNVYISLNRSIVNALHIYRRSLTHQTQYICHWWHLFMAAIKHYMIINQYRKIYAKKSILPQVCVVDPQNVTTNTNCNRLHFALVVTFWGSTCVTNNKDISQNVLCFVTCFRPPTHNTEHFVAALSWEHFALNTFLLIQESG